MRLSSDGKAMIERSTLRRLSRRLAFGGIVAGVLWGVLADFLVVTLGGSTNPTSGLIYGFFLLVPIGLVSGIVVALTSIVGRLIFARKPHSERRVLTVIGIFAGVTATCVHLFISSSTHLPWLIWGLAPVAGTVNFIGAVLIGRATFKSRPRNETAALQS